MSYFRDSYSNSWWSKEGAALKRRLPNLYLLKKKRAKAFNNPNNYQTYHNSPR